MYPLHIALIFYFRQQTFSGRSPRCLYGWKCLHCVSRALPKPALYPSTLKQSLQFMPVSDREVCCWNKNFFHSNCRKLSKLMKFPYRFIKKMLELDFCLKKNTVVKHRRMLRQIDLGWIRLICVLRRYNTVWSFCAEKQMLVYIAVKCDECVMLQKRSWNDDYRQTK